MQTSRTVKHTLSGGERARAGTAVVRMRVSLARRLVRPEATRCVRPRTLPAAAALRWAHSRAADLPLPCAAVDPEEYEGQLPPGLVAQTPSPALFVFVDVVRDDGARTAPTGWG